MIVRRREEKMTSKEHARDNTHNVPSSLGKLLFFIMMFFRLTFVFMIVSLAICRVVISIVVFFVVFLYVFGLSIKPLIFTLVFQERNVSFFPAGLEREREKETEQREREGRKELVFQHFS